MGARPVLGRADEAGPVEGVIRNPTLGFGGGVFRRRHHGYAGLVAARCGTRPRRRRRGGRLAAHSPRAQRRAREGRARRCRIRRRGRRDFAIDGAREEEHRNRGEREERAHSSGRSSKDRDVRMYAQGGRRADMVFGGTGDREEQILRVQERRNPADEMVHPRNQTGPIPPPCILMVRVCATGPEAGAATY